MIKEREDPRIENRSEGQNIVEETDKSSLLSGLRRQGEHSQTESYGDSYNFPSLGISLEPAFFSRITPDALIVTKVHPSSEAYQKGIREGDYIAEAGNVDVKSVTDFRSQINKLTEQGRSSILLLIRRKEEPTAEFFALRLSRN